MNILGIETSSQVCSVGLADARGWCIERNIIDPHIHSEKLLTLIAEVLRQAEVDLGSLDAIAISIGPGSFTGLRIGLSTAKGLCFALEKRLIDVSTFDAIAQAAFESASHYEKVYIAVDAKQGEFYVGSAEQKKSGTRSPIKVRTLRVDEVPWTESSVDGRFWVTDRPDVIRGRGIPSERIGGYSSFCRGDVVARLARDKYEGNDFADLVSIEPMYLKDFLVKKALT